MTFGIGFILGVIVAGIVVAIWILYPLDKNTWRQ